MKEEWIWFSYKRPKRLHIHDLIYSIVLLSILSKSSFCDLNCLATTIFYRHTFSFILNESPFSLFLHLLSILRGCRHSKICNNFERITRLKSLSVHISYQKYIFLTSWINFLFSRHRENHISTFKSMSCRTKLFCSQKWLPLLPILKINFQINEMNIPRWIQQYWYYTNYDRISHKTINLVINNG